MHFPRPSQSGHGSAGTNAAGTRTKGFGLTMRTRLFSADDAPRACPSSPDESSEAALAMAVRDTPVVSPSRKGGAGMPPL